MNENIHELNSLSWYLYNNRDIIMMYEKAIIENILIKYKVLDKKINVISEFIKLVDEYREKFAVKILHGFYNLTYKLSTYKFKCLFDEMHFYKYKKDKFFISWAHMDSIFSVLSYVDDYYKLQDYIDSIYMYTDDLYSTLTYDYSRLTAMIHAISYNSSDDIFLYHVYDEFCDSYHVYDDNLCNNWLNLCGENFDKKIIEYNYLYNETELEEFLIYYPKEERIKWCILDI